MAKDRTRIAFIRKVTLIRIAYISVLVLLTIASVGTVLVLKTKEFALDSALSENAGQIKEEATPKTFPVGVNPKKQLITENPAVDDYFNTYISSTVSPKKSASLSWIQKNVLAQLSQFDWFQNLASPISRILVINPGERKEEVASSFAKILRWDTAQKNTFIQLVASTTPILPEGKFYPGHYVVDKDATPQDVANILLEQFDANVVLRYTPETAQVVPLNQAMVIASLLEREAYGFDDMRYISGIIWNRLFAKMNLQIDASLQYAKGTNSTSSWWPPVRPADKYINSPYNTYKYGGLPPTAIANPSPEAILAALNPRETDCMYYFHDKDGGFHCAATYAEHVNLLKQYYGQGK